MDQNLKAAAEVGNVSRLYELIEGDGNVLKHFDEVEFIETPLHIAAEKGCIGFAMEIISLKPSLARKLNHRGLSPMHLAVEKGQYEMALRLLEVDKDLVRVRGKNGETPLHYLCKVKNQDDLLYRFLQECPEGIRGATIQNRTCLHMAVENNRLDVLRVLLQSLKRKDYYQEVVNKPDEYANTALHIAASKNQPQIKQMLKLLVESKVDEYTTNQAGLTALDVARQSNNIESISTLDHGLFSTSSKNRYKCGKQIVKYVTKASLLIFHDMDNISDDDRNVMLVILGLLLTATFQATLSPPGGLWQGDPSSNSTVGVEYGSPGTTVMDPSLFLLFFIPIYLVFIVTFFLTLGLLEPFPQGFRTALQVLLSFLAVCFHQSISIIVPNFSTSLVISIFSTIVFILMVFMCITHKVSKLSVSIVGCWIFTSFLFSPSLSLVLLLTLALIQGGLLFLFLYDQFWEGTILVLGYTLFIRLYVFVDLHEFNLATFENCLIYPSVFIGTWLFCHLVRFCQRLYTQLRSN